MSGSDGFFESTLASMAKADHSPTAYELSCYTLEGCDDLPKRRPSGVLKGKKIMIVQSNLDWISDFKVRVERRYPKLSKEIIYVSSTEEAVILVPWTGKIVVLCGTLADGKKKNGPGLGELLKKANSKVKFFFFSESLDLSPSEVTALDNFADGVIFFQGVSDRIDPAQIVNVITELNTTRGTHDGRLIFYPFRDR